MDKEAISNLRQAFRIVSSEKDSFISNKDIYMKLQSIELELYSIITRLEESAKYSKSDKT